MAYVFYNMRQQLVDSKARAVSCERCSVMSTENTSTVQTGDAVSSITSTVSSVSAVDGSSVAKAITAGEATVASVSANQSVGSRLLVFLVLVDRLYGQDGHNERSG